MKILVLQLARLGDIYMSWPALRAIKRTYPNAEIHVMTRSRFESALDGLSVVDRRWTLPTTSIIEPLVRDEVDLVQSFNRMDGFVQELQNEKFDWIVNFTFSPFSSYLTHSLTTPNTKVTGYTRHQDGSLALNDEVSAYFYAQVGLDGANRVHLADVFGSLIGVEYTEEDWIGPHAITEKLNLSDAFITCHIGASQDHKSLTPTQWGRLIRYVNQRHPNLKIALIGSESERNRIPEIRQAAPTAPILDFVGKTKIYELFEILQKTELLVGGDSAPMHMASLTDTPSLNISTGNVNFWETGPKATLSFVYRQEGLTDVHADRLGEIISSLLEGQVAPELITRTAGMVSYQIEESPAQRFAWDLVQAIYMGGSYPLAERMETVQAAMKLTEINNFALEQLALIPTKGIEAVTPYLDRAEEIINTICRFAPELSPLVSWYGAEKVRIAPGSPEQILSATVDVHTALRRHLSVYIPQEETPHEEVG
jgi:ADP-heptose:LPS heptosyltransferase